jgi:hypothetical protein
MARRRWILIGSAFVLLLAAVVLVLLDKTAEPSFEGRKLSAWVAELRPARVQSARPSPVILTRAMIAQLQTKRLSPQQLTALGIVAPAAPAVDESKHNAAAFAVRKIGTNAIPHLLPRIYARDGQFKLTCMKWSQKQKLIKIPWRSVEEDRGRALVALRQLGAQALWTWVEVATNDVADAEVQVYAAHRLSELGREAMPAVPAMLSMVNHQNPRVWSAVCWAIQQCDREGILLSLRNLRSPDRDIRASAAWSIGFIGKYPDMAIPVLVTALKDHSPLVRQEALLAIAKFGPDAIYTTNAIRNMFEDSDTGVRSTATNVLNRLLTH